MSGLSLLLLVLIALLVLVALILSRARNKMFGGGLGVPQEIHVQEPWFSEIVSGRKTIEGKVGPFRKYSGWGGRTVIFHNGPRRVTAVIRAVRHYPTLDEYLRDEGWQTVAPHTGSFAEAKTAYLAIRRADGWQVFAEKRIADEGGINALELLVRE